MPASPAACCPNASVPWARPAPCKHIHSHHGDIDCACGGRWLLLGAGRLHATSLRPEEGVLAAKHSSVTAQIPCRLSSSGATSSSGCSGGGGRAYGSSGGRATGAAPLAAAPGCRHPHCAAFRHCGGLHLPAAGARHRCGWVQRAALWETTAAAARMSASQHSPPCSSSVCRASPPAACSDGDVHCGWAGGPGPLLVGSCCLLRCPLRCHVLCPLLALGTEVHRVASVQ